MANGKNPEVGMLSNSDGPKDKEDGAWLEQNLNFRNKKQGCLPHFDFAELQKIKGSKLCADMECSLIHTLGDVKSVNSLSAASLMEIGMHMAFTKI